MTIFDEIFITGFTESCHLDNFRCSQWRKFRQKDIFHFSVYDRPSSSWWLLMSGRPPGDKTPTTTMLIRLSLWLWLLKNRSIQQTYRVTIKPTMFERCEELFRYPSSVGLCYGVIMGWWQWLPVPVSDEPAVHIDRAGGVRSGRGGCGGGTDRHQDGGGVRWRAEGGKEVREVTLHWRQNKRDGASNHRRLDCLLHRLFRCRSKKTSKLRVTGLCEGNSPVNDEFPAQRASNAEIDSIWWRHPVETIFSCVFSLLFSASVEKEGFPSAVNVVTEKKLGLSCCSSMWIMKWKGGFEEGSASLHWVTPDMRRPILTYRDGCRYPVETIGIRASTTSMTVINSQESYNATSISCCGIWITHCAPLIVRISIPRYERNLAGAQKAGELRGMASGGGIGVMWLIIFCIFSLAFWYGNQLVGDPSKGYSGGTIVMVRTGYSTWPRGTPDTATSR